MHFFKKLFVNKYDEKPFGDFTAEEVAKQITQDMTDIVEAYQKQYGFTITGIDVDEVVNKGWMGNFYYPRIKMKR